VHDERLGEDVAEEPESGHRDRVPELIRPGDHVDHADRQDVSALRAVDEQRTGQGMDEIEIGARHRGGRRAAIERIVECVPGLEDHRVAGVRRRGGLDRGVPAIVTGPERLLRARHRDRALARDRDADLLREGRRGRRGDQSSGRERSDSHE
jgi:hypothetical protein